MLDALNVVFLVHFTFPAVKLRGVFQTESHLSNLLVLLGLKLVKQLLLSLKVSCVEFDRSGIPFEVRHRLSIVMVSGNMKTFSYFRKSIRTGLDSLDHTLLELVLLVMLDLLLEVLREVVDSGVSFVVSLFLHFFVSLVDLRELNWNFFGCLAGDFQREFITLSS